MCLVAGAMGLFQIWGLGRSWPWYILFSWGSRIDQGPGIRLASIEGVRELDALFLEA